MQRIHGQTVYAVPVHDNHQSHTFCSSTLIHVADRIISMSDPLHPFRCILEGDIVIDSLIPANTSGAFCDLLTATHPTAGKLALKRPRGNCDEHLIAVRHFSHLLRCTVLISDLDIED